MEATDKVMEIPNGSSDAAQLRARAPVPVPKYLKEDYPLVHKCMT